MVFLTVAALSAAVGLLNILFVHDPSYAASGQASAVQSFSASTFALLLQYSLLQAVPAATGLHPAQASGQRSIPYSSAALTYPRQHAPVSHVEACRGRGGCRQAASGLDMAAPEAV